MERPVPIAIVGMACRLPGGASSPEKLWDLLEAGGSGHGPVPPTRWNAEAFYHPSSDARESLPFKSGYFLQEDISAFDARFFRVPPRDAHGMDPQQRVLLEVVYEALENAGMRLEDVRGSDTAVFVGEFNRDYDRMMSKDVQNAHKLHILGNGSALLANNISYYLDLKGPSFTLDTGCSGSMVAIHQACQSIRCGETSMAIAGACQLMIHPDQSIYMSQITGMVNPNGKSYVWDERGSGYGRGEGCGIVVLKRLDYARRDNDTIHAVIANTGINQDGRTAGITLPSSEAQIALAKSVYAAAGLDPAETLYIEAHGTVSEALEIIIGDREEISSIHEVFCKGTRREHNVRVGSVKANIGHLGCASGVSALIKAVMVLKNSHVPANINLDVVKSSIAKFMGGSLELPTSGVALTAPSYQGPRRVSVNGFGYGGTNAHVILTTADAADFDTLNRFPLVQNGLNVHANGLDHSKGHDSLDANTEPDNVLEQTDGITHHAAVAAIGALEYPATAVQLFVLSAASEVSLGDMATRLADWLSRRPLHRAKLRDLAYTLNVRRSRYQWRSAILAADAESLIEQLAQIKPVQAPAVQPTVTYVFTGQGAQWHAMGRELLQLSGRFQTSITQSAQLLLDWGCAWNLVDELLKDEEESHLNESELSQPATTAIQIALVDLFDSLSVRAQRVCGHSSGEIAAAYAAGALTHHAGLRISYERGIVSKMARDTNTCKGSMLSVGLGENEVRPYVKLAGEGKLVTACINSPESTTVSGDEAAIDALARVLTEKGIFNRKLKVDTAYHSPHMLAVADRYLKSLEGVVEHGLVREGTAFFSSVSGERKMDGFGAAYWVQNLVSPVQFQKAVAMAAADIIQSATGEGRSRANVFIEVGPHAALKGPARQILNDMPGSRFKHVYVSPLVRKQDALQSTLEMLAKLFEAGSSTLDMAAVGRLWPYPSSSPGQPRVLTDLPPYAWDHTSTYWHEARLSREHRFRKFPHHDLLGVLDVGADSGMPRWRHYIDCESLPWIRDHVVDGFILYPGMGYVCMAVEALKQVFELRGIPGFVSEFLLRDLKFIKPLVVGRTDGDEQQQPVEVQLTLSPEETGAPGEANKGLVPWQVVRISSFDPATALWIEHCTGRISARMQRAGTDFEVDFASTASAEVEMLDQIRSRITDACDPADFYKALALSGNFFGPTFSSMIELVLGDHEASSEVVIPDIARVMPAQFQRPHLIHPAALDALTHSACALYQRHCGNQPFVAAAIDEMTISASVSSEPGTRLSVAAQITSKTARTASGVTRVYQQDESGTAKPVVKLAGWRMHAVGEAKLQGQPGDGHEAPFSRSMTYRMQWAPDVDLMTRDDLMASSNMQMAAYVRLLALKNPAMRILEIGAGTGGATLPLLQALGGGNDDDDDGQIKDSQTGFLFERYCYTDVSVGFFEKARDKFRRWAHKMDFRPLDITRDPLGQGEFGEGQFDLVVAANVLHATPRLDETVAHCRKLLKPGGRMILLEITRLTLGMNATFGTLPGWWISEDGRENTPTVSVPSWDQVVKNNGFAGVAIAAPNIQDATAVVTTMVCRAVGPAVTTEPQQRVISILVGSKTEGTTQVAGAISQALRAEGAQVEVANLGSASIDEGASYLLLDHVEQPLLKEPSPSTFDAIRRLVTTAKSVVWVTYQESIKSINAAEMKGMVNGFTRVIRNENSSIKIVTVDVRGLLSRSYDARRLFSVAHKLAQITQKSFWPSAEFLESDELEFAIGRADEHCADNAVLVPRLRVDDKFNAWAASRRADAGNCTTKHRFHDSGRPMLLEPEVPGLLNTLRFVDDTNTMAKPLAPHQIQIRPHASGLNFKDIFVAMGQAPPGTVMAGEHAGVVTEVGSDMIGRYAVGDRVSGFGAELMANCPRLDGLGAHKLPDRLGFVEGAASTLIFATAWYGLVTMGRLQKGESVLIRYVAYSGSGGVGQAAIQIAQYLGAEIFTTVGKASKRQLVMETYGIPASHVLSSGSDNFKHRILHQTGGRGVDVVLNSLAGEQLRASVECLGAFGRFIEIGKADIYKKNHLGMASFDRGIIFAAVDMMLILHKRPRVVGNALKQVFALFESGHLRAVAPVTTLPMSRVEEAFRMMANRDHVGKIVLVADEDEQVKATVGPPPALRLNSKGTYVVIGGLGDLGRRACLLLARNGAGCVVTMSRSLPDEATLAEFKAEMAAAGNSCHLQSVRCDVSDAGNVRALAERLKTDLWPVRGVIHSGLALADRPIELMTHDEYMMAVRPKVHGTLNLHDAFASDMLDFMILLSSSTGIIGNKGQSNYAAGNTFQDAFADAQNANAGSRTRYVSLDIGAVAGSRHIASLPQKGAELQKLNILFMTFSEVMLLLEYAMSPLAVCDDFSHSIAGISKDTIKTMQGVSSSARVVSPIFKLLPEADASKDGQDGAAHRDQKKAQQDPGKLVARAKTLEAASEIIAAATAARFSAFLDVEVPVDVPIVQLALDSLVLIELKNWLSRTFQAPVQASEIAGALSINALASLLAGRSKFISDKTRASTAPKAAIVADTDLDTAGPSLNGHDHKVKGTNGIQSGIPDANSTKKVQTSHSFSCCRHSAHVSKQPLPDLDDVLDYVLSNNAHLLDGPTRLKLEQGVEQLRQPGGHARSIHAQFRDSHDDPAVDNWSADLVANALYLQRREPMAPYSSFVGGHADSVGDDDRQHSQAERAALLTRALVEFRAQIINHDVKPQWFFGKPTCNSSLRWLFDAVREPGREVDQMRLYDGPDFASRHVAVLSKGRVFKVSVEDKHGQSVPQARLRATYEAILQATRDGADVWTGILTVDGRSEWAKTRAGSIANSPANAEYLSTIESACFVLCLDDGAPESDAEQVRQAWFGNGFNRWSDKTTQLVVAANGKSTVILEHAMLDGMTAWRFSEWIQKAINEGSAEAQKLTQDANDSDEVARPIDLHEVAFKSTEEIDTQMLVLRERYLAVTSRADYANYMLDTFGTQDLMAWNMPVKSILDTVVQLAARLYYGRSVQVWESVSMAGYHRGRSDMLQATTASAVDFCTLALQNTSSLADKKAALLSLGRDFTANMQRCLAGRSHLRFLELLNNAWPKDEPKAALFEPGLLWQRPCIIMHHVPSGVACANMTHGVQPPDCFFVSVSPRDYSIYVAIDGTTGNTKLFTRRLEEAAQIIKNIIIKG
ncbi:uncharacterized protein B0I36DRAFT_286783 [Microdochium trichocladiopsis]|uniref:Polyketide synthase n=1 Tax=Microdochium trichocladiopsis TaxID=1682393 RepID=A0A9P8Y7Q9_9PEZI|nr:uncharacterized protein B0I36DRAFT_286783 [Microdochium trichocladiopsis]KAH7032672.1 hypothetical protein B0I36DRAFT_286783 [Microdochium trichocladiopsis]